MINNPKNSIPDVVLKRFVRIMKLINLFIIVGICTMNAVESYSQSTQLTLNVKNSTLEKVFKMIEEQSEFVFFYSDEAVDLMTAVQSVECGTDGYPGKVSMPFQHELARVNVVATVEGGNAIVTNITFAGMTTSGDYSSTARWSNTATGSFTNSTDQILNTEGVDLLGDMLLIPQDVSGFTVTVDYTMDGVEQPQKVITLPTTISRWEAGQSYKYTLAFKGNNIIFTVNVASWNHSTGGIITVE